MSNPPPRFAVGQRVRVVRLLDKMTTPALVGRFGVIDEVDDICIAGEPLLRLQVNYDVRWRSGGYSYMHEEELEAV